MKCTTEIWTILTAVGTIAAAGVAAILGIVASRQTSKQLKVEQQPLVVIQDRIVLGPEYWMLVKNIGRGPALRITVTTLSTDPNESLFEQSEPHSRDLGSGWADRCVFDEKIILEKLAVQYSKDDHDLRPEEDYYLFIHY